MSDPNTDSKSEQSNNFTEKDINPVFSDDEVRSTVKGFILAFIRKEVHIHFPNATDYQNLQTIKNPLKELSIEEKAKQIQHGLEIEQTAKKHFTDILEKCAGLQECSSSERRKAFQQLFKDICSYRLGNRIEGNFWDYSIEERLEKLEKKVDTTIELLRKEVRWLKEQKEV